MSVRRVDADVIREGCVPFLESGHELAGRVAGHGEQTFPFSPLVEELERDHRRWAELVQSQLEAWFEDAGEARSFWNTGMRRRLHGKPTQLLEAIWDQVSWLESLIQRAHVIPGPEPHTPAPSTAAAVEVLNVVELRDLERFLGDLRAAIDRGEVPTDPDDQAVLAAEQATLEAQQRSPRPNRGVVKAALASIGRVLEAGAGGAIGVVAIELLKRL